MVPERRSKLINTSSEWKKKKSYSKKKKKKSTYNWTDEVRLGSTEAILTQLAS